jgi:hypothetical protein
MDNEFKHNLNLIILISLLKIQNSIVLKLMKNSYKAKMD